MVQGSQLMEESGWTARTVARGSRGKKARAAACWGGGGRQSEVGGGRP